MRHEHLLKLRTTPLLRRRVKKTGRRKLRRPKLAVERVREAACQDIWKKMQLAEKHNAPISWFNDAYLASAQVWQQKMKAQLRGGKTTRSQ